MDTMPRRSLPTSSAISTDPLELARRLLDEGEPSLSDLASRTGLSASHLQRRFRAVLTGEIEPEAAHLGKLVSLAGVRRYPGRIKCALLGWHALMRALEGDGEGGNEEKDQDGSAGPQEGPQEGPSEGMSEGMSEDMSTNDESRHA